MFTRQKRQPTLIHTNTELCYEHRFHNNAEIHSLITVSRRTCYSYLTTQPLLDHVTSNRLRSADPHFPTFITTVTQLESFFPVVKLL